MRSITFTFLLLVLAVAVSWVAVIRTKEGNLDSFFGKQATKIGDRLYEFDVTKVRRIRLIGNDISAECVFENGHWQIVKPWNDRMDPWMADAILRFTLGTRVVDAMPVDKLDSAQGGFTDGTIEIRIDDEKGESLAKYRLGRKTAYEVYDEKTRQSDASVFVQTREKGRRDYVYACSGDIHPAFIDGFRPLRDHHPFYFNPLALESIRIRNAEGEMQLSRQDPGEKTPWRIVMPLPLRTDVTEVKRLLSDLMRMQAKRVSSRAEVTLPAVQPGGTGHLIALRHFGEKEETILEIFPAKPDAETVYAVVSNRPDAVFELLNKPVAPEVAGAPMGPDDTIVTLATLPDTVNELRNQTLTNLDVTSLQGIMIIPSTGEPIALGRQAENQHWQLQLADGQQQQPLNELALFKLLKAVTTTRVAGFPDDAATDLAPYGLDRPSLALRFVAFGNEGFELRFGQGRDGTWYAMRTGVATVMKVDETFIGQISLRSWEWRQTRLLSFATADFANLERTFTGNQPLQLEYDFYPDIWTAYQQGKDRSSELAKDRCNRLLQTLSDLNVKQWLAPDDPEAARAMTEPALKIKVLLKNVNEEGDFAGTTSHTLTIAPGSNAPGNRVFYGRLDKEEYPFLLDPGTVRNLAVDLFGND